VSRRATGTISSPIWRPDSNPMASERLGLGIVQRALVAAVLDKAVARDGKNRRGSDPLDFAIEPPTAILHGALQRARAPCSIRSHRNSPAKSEGLVVNNNEIYKAGEFRVQRQRRAPRPTANNNEYQGENKGRVEAPCLRAGCRSWSAATHIGQNKARRGFPPGHTNSVSISRII
jgi:hypothetical protein